MALYRTVNLSFWTDSKVDDEFTPEEKYFYLYLLTNPHTNIAGCYEVSMKQMCRETGYNEDTVLRLLGRMSDQHRVISFNPKTKEVLIVNWHKYNWTSSPKVLTAVVSAASDVKCKQFRAYLAERLEAYGVDKDTISILYPYPMDTTVTATVTDTVSVTDTVKDNNNSNDKKAEAKSKSKPKTFVPPTLEEVEEYARSRNSSVNPRVFWEYFDTGNWRDSEGKPVQNWKQKLITWEKNDRGGTNRGYTGNASSGNQRRTDIPHVSGVPLD